MFTLLVTLSVAVASNAFTVSGTGTSSSLEPPRQCIARATEHARAKAMEHAPREVATTFLDTQSVHNEKETQFVHSYSATLQRALFRVDRIDEKPLLVDAQGNVRCEVVLAGSFLDVGTPDPSFLIQDFALSQPSYFVGQDAALALTLTAPAYVYIINVDGENDVTLVYPNANTPPGAHLVEAKRRWIFPTAGTKLTAALPTGASQSVEMLQVIAVRDQPNLFSDAKATQMGPFKVLELGDMSSVITRLAAIKRTQWTTAVAAYTIRAR